MAEAMLNIKESSSGSAHVIATEGEIDAKTSPDLKHILDLAIESGKKKIILDFSSLKYISSAGIGVLNSALHALKGSGGAMAIVNPEKTVRDTLDVMYFSKKVVVYSSLQSAIKGLG